MTTKALFVRLEAKAGKENEVAKFLRDGQGLVAQEPATTAWFGIRLGPTTFAIFDAFSDDAGRDAHLSGKVAKALMEKAPELLAEPPTIEKPTYWQTGYRVNRPKVTLPSGSLLICRHPEPEKTACFRELFGNCVATIGCFCRATTDMEPCESQGLPRF
jgi:quinol monooxygenase YgiN